MKNRIISAWILALFSITGFAQNKMNAEGKREGKWIGYHDNTHNLRYEGNFINGIEQGVFTYYADEPGKKIIATIDFSKGNGNAYSVFYDGKGHKTSEGNYKNKKKEGKWTYYHQGGVKILSEEYYVNDKLEGIKKVYYPSGKLSQEITYKNGEQNGVAYRFSEDGIKLVEENYLNGKLHGKAIYRDADGNIESQGEYKNGLRVGEWANIKPKQVKPVSKK